VADVTLRPLAIGDRVAYRDLRLRALREEPEAFTSSFEEEAASAERWAVERLSMPPAPSGLEEFADAGAIPTLRGLARLDAE